jgi:hypothetical protein
MSITTCPHCGNQYDQDTNVEHEDVCKEELNICGIDFNESVKQLDGLIKQAHNLTEKYKNNN